MQIGIDLGATAIKAGLVDNGKIVEKLEILTKPKRGYDSVKSDIIKLIDELKLKSQEQIEYVGIGIPGIATPEGDRVIICVNLGWNNVPLGVDIKEKTKLPVFIGNDATVAGIAENMYGSTKGHKNALFITIGTGVGGGIIINGKVHSGSNGIGSEIGHMIIGENFYNCNCGKNGCLETFSSATAMTKYTQKIIKEGYDTLILEKVKGNIENINAKIIFDCAKDGDKVANMVVNRMVKYLSIGISNLIDCIDPSIIALGGGVSKAGDYLLDKIKKQLPKYLTFESLVKAEILIAELGNDAGIMGAANLGKYI